MAGSQSLPPLPPTPPHKETTSHKGKQSTRPTARDYPPPPRQKKLQLVAPPSRIPPDGRREKQRANAPNWPLLHSVIMRRIPSYYAGINGTAAAYVQQKRTTEVKAFNNTPPPAASVSSLLFSFFFVVPAFKKTKKLGSTGEGAAGKPGNHML